MEPKIITWLLFVAINAGIAFANNQERLAHIKDGNPAQVNHTLWTLLYLMPCIGLAFYNWHLACSILLLRASVFPIFYNLMAKLPAFNLSKTTTSKYDTFLRSFLDDMVLPDTISFTASIFFLWV
jgi:hypothetical protein